MEGSLFTMLGALLITFREGLEAALIIGILLAYLARTDNRRAFTHVWLGTGLAVTASLIAGVVIYFSFGKLEGRAEEIFEGFAMVLAAGILTWMIFWMRKQAINMKGELQTQLQSVLSGGSSFGLVVLAFIAVAREGIETVLFLFAATRIAESQVLFISGGLLGLALAIAMGYSLYRDTSRLNLSAFFNITGILLILFAAGLLAHGIHEFQEAGIIPTVVEHMWDMNQMLPEDSIFGRFLTAIFGYNANPSMIEVITYVSYLVIAFTAYFSRNTKKNVRNG